MAVMLLEANSQITTDDVVGAVDQVALHCSPGAAADREQLIRDVEAACNVYVPGPTALDGDDDHLEWLPDRRGEIDWKLWRSLPAVSGGEKGLAPQATSVWTTSPIKSSAARKPDEARRWDRRGMVVGHVQSGKTANYTGLICKAADAGYKLIIVLAGMDDSLRSQTQLRLDEGFLGFDTQKRDGFDQGEHPPRRRSSARRRLLPRQLADEQRAEGRLQEADCSRARLDPGGADPLLLVVKKNKSDPEQPDPG